MLSQAIQFIKEGKIIFLAGSGFSGIAGDPSRVDAVHLSQTFPLSESTLLIGEIGLLYKYVQQIPEVAWDIVDYSENSLTVIYPLAKNLSREFTPLDGAVKIRLIKSGPLHQLLNKLGTGIFYIPVNKNELGKYNTSFNLLLGIGDEAKKKEEAVKTIRLELNGEIKFLN